MIVIERRDVLLGGVALAAIPSPGFAALPVPPGDRVGFDIFRNGSKIGTQVLTFERTPGGLTIRVVAQMVVKIAFVTVYRYNLRVTERWEGDQVVALDSTTNDNGKKFTVKARREAAGFVVEGSAISRYVAPANALPATHWNRRQLDGPWINPQDGKLTRPTVTKSGVESVPTVPGKTVTAQKFVLSGDVQWDMWYDQTWAGLLAKQKDGSQIRYLRQ
jgi:Family of unknown function (DUF6134)